MKNIIIKEDNKSKIEVLLQKRKEARDSKDWDLADHIRHEIDQLGYVVEDTAEGPIIKRK